MFYAGSLLVFRVQGQLSGCAASGTGHRSSRFVVQALAVPYPAGDRECGRALTSPLPTLSTCCGDDPLEALPRDQDPRAEPDGRDLALVNHLVQMPDAHAKEIGGLRDGVDERAKVLAGRRRRVGPRTDSPRRRVLSFSASPQVCHLARLMVSRLRVSRTVELPRNGPIDETPPRCRRVRAAGPLPEGRP